MTKVKHKIEDLKAALALLEYRDGALYWLVTRGGTARAGSEAGSVHPDGYRTVRRGKYSFATHRLIFLLFHGWLPDEVDHINLNRLDNRIENLRAATASQNQRNTTARCTSKSGIKNVSWNTAEKKWVVQIQSGAKKLTLGKYDDLELAALVAIMAREKYHGAFARHA